MHRMRLVLCLLVLAAHAEGPGSSCSAAAPVSPSRSHDWPQWRGPRRDDISRETGLLKRWPEQGPRLLWTADDLGIGYSGPAIVAERLYILGAKNGIEMLMAFDVQSGKQLWAVEVGPQWHNAYGDGPRGTPTVDGGQVFALGGQGDLVCVDIRTEKVVWRKSLKSDLHGKMMSGWGYSESPLVDDDRVVCTPGGQQGALAALDRKTGEVLWRSKEFTDDAGYSSIIVSHAAGVRQYVQQTGNHVAGFRPSDGQLLWSVDRPNKVAAVPTPVSVGDSSIYVTSGYGAGCALVELTGSADSLSAREVYANKNMTNHHGGVVLLDGYIYGYSEGKGWVCQDVKTGTLKWPDRPRLPKGSITCADGMLYCYSEDDGTIVLVEPSPDAWKEHGRFRIPQSSKLPRPPKRRAKNVWTHPVIANGSLYLRDQEFLFCFDVRADKQSD